MGVGEVDQTSNTRGVIQSVFLLHMFGGLNILGTIILGGYKRCGENAGELFVAFLEHFKFHVMLHNSFYIS